VVPSSVPSVELRDAALERVHSRLFSLSRACDASVSADALVGDALTLCRDLAGPSSLAESLASPEASDVAFVVATDLRGARKRLAAALPTTRADESARATRHVLRALSVLTQALGLPRLPSAARDRLLRTSLSTRRRYATLRRSILGPAPPTDATSMARSLARVRIQTTLLARSEEYRSLRSGDRDQLEELRARLDRTLKDRDAIDVRDAERLWQDLAGFARLSAAINRRHELIENDTTIIDEATETLATQKEIRTRLRMRLETLAGLDDEVDALIERYEWNVEPWREALLALHERLVRPATGRFTRVTPLR